MLGLFMRYRGWIAAIPLALGIGIVFVSLTIADDAARLDDEGVAAEATIIGKREVERRTGTNSSNRRTDYELRYHFPVGGGALHYGTRDVSRDFFDGVAVGDTVPVRYLADDPDLNEIEPGAVNENALYAGIFGAVLLLGGALFAWLVARKASRAAAAIARGVQTDATVFAVVTASGANHLRFRYADAAGTEHEAMTMLSKRARLADIAEGQTIRVRYDPQHPKRVFWERDLGL
ncbi:MAG: DUF3592 domain-containing protein [Alphaproteobacteria bacterium]